MRQHIEEYPGPVRAAGTLTAGMPHARMAPLGHRGAPVPRRMRADGARGIGRTT